MNLKSIVSFVSLIASTSAFAGNINLTAGQSIEVESNQRVVVSCEGSGSASAGEAELLRLIKMSDSDLREHFIKQKIDFANYSVAPLTNKCVLVYRWGGTQVTVQLGRPLKIESENVSSVSNGDIRIHLESTEVQQKCFGMN